MSWSHGRLTIVQPAKFTNSSMLSNASRSADFAIKHGQEVLYITERAVFRLASEGHILLMPDQLPLITHISGCWQTWASLD